MRLIPSDPDVETILGRIKNKSIDLQPDFQRGEVWSQAKQRRLVDSILRDWHVPPIHVVQQPLTKKQEVLDGQQRLVAIRDFANGAFTVDGKTEPIDPRIQSLHGMRYADLPEEWQRQFNQFSIRFFLIVDFAPEEPAELFFRLNQPVVLTSAEQRNAFFGPIRAQVKELLTDLEGLPFGFSNSRMALDDVLARVCLCAEQRAITQKITATKLADRYRAKQPFSAETMAICKGSVECFAESADAWTSDVRLNKATLFSWLWLAACMRPYFGAAAPSLISHSLLFAESLKNVETSDAIAKINISPSLALSGERLFSIIRLYLDRSSSRVSDVSSVIARDLFLWMLLANASVELSQPPQLDVPYLAQLEGIMLRVVADDKLNIVDLLNEIIESGDWGQLK